LQQSRHNTVKAEPGEIKRINISFDHLDRVVLIGPVLLAFRKRCDPVAIDAFSKALYRILLQPGNSCATERVGPFRGSPM
jgi:hypothetical protein